MKNKSIQCQNFAEIVESLKDIIEFKQTDAYIIEWAISLGLVSEVDYLFVPVQLQFCKSTRLNVAEFFILLLAKIFSRCYNYSDE